MSSVSSPRPASLPVLLCFSPLRWHSVYQRPQHLMSRFARHYRVLYFEEPIFDALNMPHLEVREVTNGVNVLVPHLLPSPAVALQEHEDAQRKLLNEFLVRMDARPAILWHCTPMSLAMSDHLNAGRVVYDCMDELSSFRGVSGLMVEREKQLLAKADVVFTGDYSLYEAKQALHANVHAFPSSVDVHPFLKARESLSEPDDQKRIPRPRLGFHGVLDERLDMDLLAHLADLRPDWHFVLLGPVVKLDPKILPRRNNIHYLGNKSYDALPSYLSGWDVGIMPFARNPPTDWISPAKTLEYLAAGRAVVSTGIKDVVRSFGRCGMVSIADSPAAFMHAVIDELQRCKDRQALCERADAILEGQSWDKTWSRMAALLSRPKPAAALTPEGVVLRAVQKGQVASQRATA